MRGSILTVAFVVVSAATGLLVYNEHIREPYCSAKDLNKLPADFTATNLNIKYLKDMPSHCIRFLKQQAQTQTAE